MAWRDTPLRGLGVMNVRIDFDGTTTAPLMFEAAPSLKGSIVLEQHRQAFEASIAEAIVKLYAAHGIEVYVARSKSGYSILTM
jgi:hypothetical protein